MCVLMMYVCIGEMPLMIVCVCTDIYIYTRVFVSVCVCLCLCIHIHLTESGSVPGVVWGYFRANLE